MMRLRRIAVLAVLLASGATAALATPAYAIDEGGSDQLREQLDAASKGFVEAKNKLSASEKRQKELTEELKTIEEDLVVREKTVGELAGRTYRNGRLAPMVAILNASEGNGFMDRATLVETMTINQEKQVQNLVTAKDEASRAKTAIESEIGEQKKQVENMEKRKKQAESALRAAGGGAAANVESGSGSAAVAVGAQRNPDGSFPSEGCTVNDPTPTGGCITPRLLHAFKQTKSAGFNHFVNCYRSAEDGGEHPRGRACDWSAQASGFGGVASGSDKVYGDNLANFYIKNADRLGVLYVIWFRRIWLPSSGWQSYSGGGSPSGDHTNHVHLSVI
jgi:peptidoglycan DL-endopeptidase CwlO